MTYYPQSLGEPVWIGVPITVTIVILGFVAYLVIQPYLTKFGKKP